jgi:4-amino-4-deoxy-L-arabinose transferase-like glycosyltransferase
VDIEATPRESWHRSGLLASLTIGLLLVVFRAVLPTGVFWISDAGNKFIEVQNFVAGQYRHIAVAYTGATIDPGFRWFPSGGGHFLRLGTRFFSIVPFQFPLINAPLYSAFGAAGLTIIPLAAGIGILLLVPTLTRRLDARLSAAVAVFLVALATPIAFYSLDFWEHTAATFFATLAVLILLRNVSPRFGPPSQELSITIGGGQAFLAGVTVGLSIALREEGYVFLLAIIGAMASRRRLRPIAAFIAGTAIVVAPLLVAQQRIYGSFLGLHLLSHTGTETLASRLLRIAHNYAYFLFQMHERPPVATLLALPAVVAIILGSSRKATPVARLAGVASLLVASAIALLAALSDRDPILNTIWTQGLLLFIPLLSFFLVNWRNLAARRDATGLLSRIVILYTLAMPLLLRANWTGIVWGPRYFITVLPLATILSMLAANELREAAGGAPRLAILLTTAAIAVSVAFEAHGFSLLHRKLVATAGLARLLRSEPSVLVTDVFWLPEEMAQLFFEKNILMPPNGPELAAALEALRAHGVTEFSYVTSPLYHSSDPRTFQLLRPLAVRRVRYVSRDVPLLTVDVIRCRIPPAHSEPR